MKLARICSEFNKGPWKIHQFGYDENGNSVTRVNNFKDYFYYSEEHLDDLIDYKGFEVSDEKCKSLYGEETRKIYYTSVKNVRAISKRYPNRAFESDVPPEFKYVIDKKLEWSKHRHIMYFDIETWWDPNDNTANDPGVARMPITSIQMYSNVHKKYYVMSWHPEHTQKYDEPKTIEDGKVTYIFTKTEHEMLMTFYNMVDMYNVDILSGWYTSQFDLPYIINRSKNIGIDYKKLSPTGYIKMYKNRQYWKLFMTGMEHIDMMEALQDLGYNLPNWKLATAAKEILKDPDVEKMTEATWKNWKDDYKGFLEYGIRDVEILVEISEKLDIFELYYTLQEMANLPQIGLVLFKSMIVDNYILKSFHGKMVFPTRHTSPRQSFAGAMVLDPVEPGSHKDVAVLDYTSLYPTTIMAFNISPETFIASEAQCKQAGMDIEDIITQLKEQKIDYIDTKHDDELFGGRYLFYGHSHKLGMLPFLLKTMFQMRVEINRKLDANEYETENEAYSAEKKQGAIKLILNSTYGAMGFNYFRLYKPECADATTYFARNALKYAVVQMHKEFDYPILYGDTDSTFVKLNNKSIDKLKEDLLSFDDKLKTDFALNFATNIDPNYFFMNLKFEKDLEHIYFGTSKKRYYSIQRGSNKRYIRGLNIIRKDAPSFMKTSLDKLAELSVKKQIRLSHLLELRQEIENTNYSELGISKSFSRRFDEYVKTMPQHVKAAVWANDILGTELSNLDNPLLYYVKSNCEDDLKPRERQSAICLNEEDLHLIDKNKDKFEMDYETFFQKQVLDQLKEFSIIPEVKQVLEQYKEKEKQNG